MQNLEALTTPTLTASTPQPAAMPPTQLTEIVADAIKTNAEPFLRKVPTWAAALIGILGTIIFLSGAFLYVNKDFFLKYQENSLEIQKAQFDTQRLKDEVDLANKRHDLCHDELDRVKEELIVVKEQLRLQQLEILKLQEQKTTAKQ